MSNAGVDEAQAGIKIAVRNINKLRYSDDTALMAKSEEELESLFFFIYFYLLEANYNIVMVFAIH